MDEHYEFRVGYFYAREDGLCYTTPDTEEVALQIAANLKRMESEGVRSVRIERRRKNGVNEQWWLY